MAQTAGRFRRGWLFGAVAVVIFVGILLSSLSGFYVDLLWFREVGFAGVFWSVYWSKVVLGVIFGTLFFLLLAANLFIARRLTPRFRPFSPEQELIERYRMAFEPYARPIILGFSAVIALFVGIAAAAQWQTFLLWRSAGSTRFGLVDPLFHRDPSFYIFILPFQKFVQGWLFSALVGVTVIAAIAHYLSGGIRLQSAGEKVTPQVKAHLSVLLGFIVLVKSWGYYLGQFDLLVSPRGVVTGASYTDVHAQLPALRLLTFIAIACAILFLVNIRFRGWALPGFGVGLLFLASIVVGAIVPAFVQKFRVDPQELQKEAEYIAKNIEATRFAYGLNKIKVTQQSSVADDVTSGQLDDNSATIDNIRLWRPEVLRNVYDQVQRIQPYYEFSDVDVDRYDIAGGSRRVVMLSAREVSQDGIPGGGGTWQNKHLVYTHGYGAVGSPVNTVTTEGAPVFVLSDIPPIDRGIPLSPTGAQIYYGERADVPYVIVGGEGQGELNYPDPSGRTVTTTYRGKGGIPVGGFFRRALFAYRYRDINLLISGLINRDSRVLINRDIRVRIRKAAPFLSYDGDPYAAIVGGRLVYIWDAYTTTTAYPYSQEMSIGSVTGRQVVGRVNYIRNSVKAVVDAYDGTVTFYVVDPNDPLIQVWERAFPNLFATQPPSPELLAHFRYPENLLQIQAAQFVNYHVTDTTAFYFKQNFWAVPNALSTSPKAGATSSPMRPYYVLIKVPGTQNEQFVLFMPLTPSKRANMVAYLAALSDPGEYPGVAAFEFPGGENIDGPQQVRARVDQDPNVSREVTLLSQQGSTVVFGDLLVIPIEDSFLYAQPIFVVSSQVNAIPELKRVAVVHGGSVTLGNSLQEAIAASFGETVPPPVSGGGGPPPTGDVAKLLQEALDHFQKAQQALQNQDLATYQAEIDKARQLIQQASELAGKTPSPSPSPSASPSG
ncbi:MAG TPA: UPF0182 family protein [Actinomycetota bacterium]